MHAKSLALLLVALGCGLVASIGITQVMAKRTPDEPVADGDGVQVFVAMKCIAMSDAITARNVKVEHWRPEKLLPGYVSTWEDLEGRLTKVTVEAGWPIYENQLLPKGVTEARASSRIEKNNRVVPVKVEPENVGGGIIRPGDRVDVLVHVKADSQGGITKTATVTVLQNIKVFAVNDVYDVGAAEEKSMAAKTISLEVSPQDAQVLTMATEIGKIRLVLRSPEDTEKVKLSAQELQKILGGQIAQTTESTSAKHSKPAAADDMMDMLKQLVAPKKPATDSVAVATALSEPKVESTEKFSIRIMSGTELIETVLEAPKGSSSGENSGAPGTWRINSSKSTSFDQGSSNRPAVGPLSGRAKRASSDDKAVSSILKKGKENMPKAPAL